MEFRIQRVVRMTTFDEQRRDSARLIRR